ncbi:phosphoesterase [Deferribacter autotrophicus]|uniref:Phosphoesterase n=1 Tax=Deferribacter autotrophicus TaxID=500465 RepID=A0A5A8F8N6_9BACT|nr:DHHA1 domain-containing protein [Deferribacter autotrophicus]KAA0259021.1 phosphoesterase [Deferribacter autotrophicus]
MILHITHNDLDGAGCGILVKKTLPDVVTYYLNYDEVDEFLKNNYVNFDKIIITDVAPSKDIFDLIYREKDVLLIDHHKTTLHFRDYKGVIHSLDKCATFLTYEWLLKEGFEINEYEDFVKVVNDYDIWILEDSRSLELNMLFYLYGLERFVDRFLKKPSVDFEEKESFLLEIERGRQKDYLEKAKDYVTVNEDKEGRRFGYIFAEMYNSELGHFLINELKLDYVIIINAQKKKISLRSRKDIDVSIIAKRNGGGGHKNAAGFSTDFDFGINLFLKNMGVL